MAVRYFTRNRIFRSQIVKLTEARPTVSASSRQMLALYDDSRRGCELLLYFSLKTEPPHRFIIRVVEYCAAISAIAEQLFVESQGKAYSL